MNAISPPLQVGVMGCGDIAWRNILPAMERAGVEIVAAASRDPEKARRFGQRFGCEPLQGYEALLEQPGIDAVYIALPTGLHFTWAKRALEAGRHVLAEKPLATSLAQTEVLVATARAHGRWLADNFGFVHHSQHTAVRKMIAEGLIGEPRSFSAAFGIPPLPAEDIRYRPELGGGALLDLGVYTARSARLMLGSEFSVLGSVLRMDRHRDIDLDGSALLCSTDGVPADLGFSFRTSYRSGYAVWGSEGRITLNRAFTPPPTLRPVIRLERQDRTEEITLPADDQFANLVRDFARCALGGADFEPQGKALLNQAALVDEIRDVARRVTV
ncbi:Gfo/Idh/MocA family protein [Streptomyces sp. NPDC048516]|uniref:Gfo/Idh/MocA family protein n=1 Tax=Streptomyces sp. NPDC048516 TaxID=3365565 RepID=UPI00371B8109